MKPLSPFCRYAIILGIPIFIAFVGLLVISVIEFSGLITDKKGDDSVNLLAKESVRAFLDQYDAEFPPMTIRSQEASWMAETTGKPEYFEAEAKEALAMRTYLSDRDRFEEAKKLLKLKDQLDPTEARALELVYQEYKTNQVPPDLLKRMVELRSETTEAFNTFRGTIDGKAYTNNQLLEVLNTSDDSEARRKAWEALKQPGEHISTLLIELVEARNAAARAVGYKNFWEMNLDQQDFTQVEIQKLFDELDELTREPFMQMKAELDAELAERFKISPEQVRPWHYNNPYFQDAQPNEKIDLNEFYSSKSKEQIVEIAQRFYQEINLPIEGVLKRSDLFEREGKSQHAFCTSINRKADVRTLCNIQPTATWMDTMLHEQGHAVYDLGIDRSMRFVLRTPTQSFTTEAVAMFFGALAKSPEWMIAYADADPKRVDELRMEIAKQRRAEQLTFCRFTILMFNFECELYKNPRQDLNRLWWKMAEKYQGLHLPEDWNRTRNKADWAAKMHFHAAPVYYHGYMLGDLFSSQLRSEIARQGIKGWTPELGRYFTDSLFRSGSLLRWPEFVESATGEPLSAKAFAAEVKQ